MIKVYKDEVNMDSNNNDDLQSTISEILLDVKNNGDAALKKYTKRFDNLDLDDFKVSEEEIIQAKNELSSSLLDDIQYSVNRITEFAKAQKETLIEFEKEMIPGLTLGQKVIPIDSVGAYIPGGSYPLLSSAQMAIIPAQVAGVKNIRVCSPPTFNGSIHPAVIYAAHLAGADEIFKVGGAQAIAALAYGTDSIKAVNKITGPGNRFVTEAKRQVNGLVGIDLLAGPSEILVLADDNANPKFIAADLLAQSEHDKFSQGILVTTSEELAKKTEDQINLQLKSLPTSDIAKVSWENRGKIYVTDNLDEAIELTNDLASEHLHVHIENAKDYLESFTNYGSLFLGQNSSVVYADKTSGTNHILPTNKAAKYTGGVWVGTFTKVVTYQHLNEEAVQELAPFCVRQSQREGLIGHSRSANVRLNGELDI